MFLGSPYMRVGKENISCISQVALPHLLVQSTSPTSPMLCPSQSAASFSPAGNQSVVENWTSEIHLRHTPWQTSDNAARSSSPTFLVKQENKMGSVGWGFPMYKQWLNTTQFDRDTLVLTGAYVSQPIVWRKRERDAEKRKREPKELYGTEIGNTLKGWPQYRAYQPLAVSTPRCKESGNVKEQTKNKRRKRLSAWSHIRSTYPKLDTRHTHVLDEDCFPTGFLLKVTTVQRHHWHDRAKQDQAEPQQEKKAAHCWPLLNVSILK